MNTEIPPCHRPTPNFTLGLGASGWIAQFGAVGILMLLLLTGSWHFLATTDRLQQAVLEGVRELHAADLEERRADRERTMKLVEKIESLARTIERLESARK